MIGMQEELFPEVFQAIPGEGHSVYAYLNDGSVRWYDVAPLIQKGGVFAPLEDIDVFRSTLTVMNKTIAWDIEGSRDARNCIDIDPFTIYESKKVKDPLTDKR